jgi:hypothetical protein
MGNIATRQIHVSETLDGLCYRSSLKAEALRQYVLVFTTGMWKNCHSSGSNQ